MRAVVQRVNRGECRVEGKLTGRIGPGLLVFLGAGSGDTAEDIDWLLDKLLKARIFEDEAGRMNRSVEDIGGGLLLISQFTLYGSMKKGTRPSFNRAEDPERAEALYDLAVSKARQRLGDQRLGTGRFGSSMQIEAHNDGPVTLIFDTRQRDF